MSLRILTFLLLLLVPCRGFSQPSPSYPAGLDSSFNQGSGITAIALNTRTIERLNRLGVLWGFLKYYHPAAGRGAVNIDAALFRILPGILAADSREAEHQILADWIHELDSISADSPKQPVSHAVSTDIDCTFLCRPSVFSEDLQQMLFNIQHTRSSENKYYVGYRPGIGNAVFQNELNYPAQAYPDAGTRLLALYRFWNYVQYFYPYKELIGKDWCLLLPELIPDFIKADNEAAYIRACLKMLAMLHDAHAVIRSYSAGADSLKGTMTLPLETRFIEDKLTVVGYYTKDTGIMNAVAPGDIITSVDGISIEKLVKKYEPLTIAPNRPRMLRELTSLNGFLLRSNKQSITLEVSKGGKSVGITLPATSVYDINPVSGQGSGMNGKGYRILGSRIGYLYPALLKEEDLATIKDSFRNYKGLIIDLRCYPKTFMPFTYGKWLKPASTPFVSFIMPDPDMPGCFRPPAVLNNGEQETDNFRGKIILLVDEYTQSQAEYTVMALQSAHDVIVLGSQTAGSDGDLTLIQLPGGVVTGMSGIGILYPDGTVTQRKGIRIDIICRPTIKGIKEQRDELLEKALSLLQ